MDHKRQEGVSSGCGPQCRRKKLEKVVVSSVPSANEGEMNLMQDRRKHSLSLYLSLRRPPTNQDHRPKPPFPTLPGLNRNKPGLPALPQCPPHPTPVGCAMHKHPYTLPTPIALATALPRNTRQNPSLPCLQCPRPHLHFTSTKRAYLTCS